MAFTTLQFDSSFNPSPLSADLCFITTGVTQCTYLLPSSPTAGDIFRVMARDNLWQIQQRVGQQIVIGDAATTVGTSGSLNANKITDSVEIVAIDGGTIFRCQPLSGNPTIV
jgi:hypothetical protein